MYPHSSGCQNHKEMHSAFWEQNQTMQQHMYMSFQYYNATLSDENLIIQKWGIQTRGATFSSFSQSLHISSRFPPGQDVPLRIPGQDISCPTEHEALDKFGLLVFLEGKGGTSASSSPLFSCLDSNYTINYK